MPFDFSSPLLAGGAASPSHGLNIPPQLARLGIDLPDDLVAHRAHLDKLTERVRAVGDSHEIEQRILAALEADADAALDDGLMSIATIGIERQALRLAEFNAWLRHGRILLAHADDLISGGLAVAFGKYVEEIAPLTGLDMTDLAALATQERTDDILAVSRADQALARIRQLRKIRRLLVLDVGRAMHRANSTIDRFGTLLQWRDPDRVVDAGDTLVAFVANLRAGAGPWLATLAGLESRRLELAPPDPSEVDTRTVTERERAARASGTSGALPEPMDADRTAT